MAPNSINIWEHGERLGGAGWKRRYCNVTKSGGGVTRLKEHLAGRHGDVVACSGVLAEIRRLMLASLEEAKARKKAIKDQRLRMEQAAGEPVARGPSSQDVFDDDEEMQMEWARRELLEVHRLQQRATARGGTFEHGGGSGSGRGRGSGSGRGSGAISRSQSMIVDSDILVGQASRQTRIDTALRGGSRSKLGNIWSKWFHSNDIPGVKAECPYFRVSMQLLMIVIGAVHL